jgi:hypothetical protein
MEMVNGHLAQVLNGLRELEQVDAISEKVAYMAIYDMHKVESLQRIYASAQTTLWNKNAKRDDKGVIVKDAQGGLSIPEDKLEIFAKKADELDTMPVSMDGIRLIKTSLLVEHIKSKKIKWKTVSNLIPVLDDDAGILKEQ